MRVLGTENRAVPGGGALSVPGRCERGESRRRRRVLDVAVQAVGQAEELTEPVDGKLLKLGRSRRGAPQHRVHVEGGGEELREDARLGPGDGEVREEAR